MTESMCIRAAIRQVLRKASIAKDTGNREMYSQTRDWLKRHIRQRNTGKRIFYQA